MTGDELWLRVSGLTKTAGDRAILRGVDLEAAPGELVAVVGKSGSGKTTLLRLIAGLDAPTTGQVTLNGRPRAAIHARVRMAFQESRLLPWRRVIENVQLGLPPDEAHFRQAAQALARVGLAGRERDWPWVLSGGEKQRVALSRALVSRPGLLLLDEPLGALDALTRLEMQRLLERIWLETPFTALLVTHDVQEAVALADRVISLEDGVVALNVAVNLPRPRDRQSPAFTTLTARILERLLSSPSSEVATPATTSSFPRPSGARMTSPGVTSNGRTMAT
jgi:sulfonate transport system ATP-binding protein